MRYAPYKVAVALAAAAVAYAFAPAGAKAQSLFDETYANGETIDLDDEDEASPRDHEPLPVGPWEFPVDTNLIVEDLLLPRTAFMPAIFDTYSLQAPAKAFNPLEERYNDNWDATTWADRTVARDSRVRAFIQQYMIAHPETTRRHARGPPRSSR